MKMFVINYYADGSPDWHGTMRAESLEEVIRRTSNWGKVIEIFEVGSSVYKATDLPLWLSSMKEEYYTEKR